MLEKIKNLKLPITIAVIVLGFSGLALYFKSSDNNKNQQILLSIDSIKKDISKGGQLIDVRTSEEYSAGHIDGSINLSLQDIQAGKYPLVTKDKPIYIYCHSGNRAGQATSLLKSAGYRNAIDLGAIAHVQALGGVIKKS